MSSRVTTLEVQLAERLPRPIAEDLAPIKAELTVIGERVAEIGPIKEKLAEISARLQAIDTRSRDTSPPAAPPDR